MDINWFTWSLELDKYYDLMVQWALSYLPKILWAIIVLWIWFKIIRMIEKALEKLMEIKDRDEMLEWFILNLSSWIMKILLVITVVGILGVETSSIVAMVAAAGFAIGMALSGTLQNFAGWIMILILRPFKIGHFVDIAGHSGVVKKIHIFNSMIVTADKKKIILPNSDIINSPITNFSSEPKRRVDFVIGIGYSDDIDKAKKILLDIASKDERILDSEWVTLWVWALGASSVDIDFRFFVKRDDYWDVYRETLETIKKTFDKKWVSFPFPQRDVHIYNES